MIKSHDDPLAAKANAAFDEVALDVVARARAAKTEIVVWRGGKVERLSPDQIERELSQQAANTGTESAE